MIRLDDIEAKAMKATPGPWDARCKNKMDNTAKPRHIWSEYGFIGEMDSESSIEDAKFIASMNPTTALALIRVARAARDYYFAPYCDDHECGCHEAHHEDLKEALKEIET